MYLLPQRKKNYSKWYNELVAKADLAEISGVRGCMIVKSFGFSIWEKMQEVLDKMFKDTGHKNVYFPLFIPKSYLSKEISYADGFAKECAVVTHYRLKTSTRGNIIVDPLAKLEEELIIRPTSEPIVWESFRRWIQSYRDLPILLNQWANVVRWEMRTRLFLRTSEFLWQEGHTAHDSRNEAITETEKMLEVYTEFSEKLLAIPVIQGFKSSMERFSGAKQTYCIEAMMQDGKSLQVGTSHFLGQKFSKAFDVKFTDKFGEQNYVWATSWGCSTRLMGAMIMAHSDDHGLILPPKIAPIQLVIIPIFVNQIQLDAIEKVVLPIKRSLEKQGISVIYDNRERYSWGCKLNEYEVKGIPLRIIVGQKEIENREVEIFRRDTMVKNMLPQKGLVNSISELLEEIQKNMFQKALVRRNYLTTEIDSYEDFKEILDAKGGFLSAFWDGSIETEEKIKKETTASIRCIPFNRKQEKGLCIFSGRPSFQRVFFAKSY
ncbi:prolyl-tRNA synthetase [Candidatus Uzinura diaspidicola str. ASNER]|uniref:Proline--tRNA ligase n=1 Tax=Candidatus Uzinura diaspidicola str. ASNER TaxID=1133592 RepID=L7VGA5_9FLAO|nr:prolyl-tRNA synthetase [Candidatus Uzinura diaspidicola str. ASNER]